jgi:hypothetical protein
MSKPRTARSAAVKTPPETTDLALSAFHERLAELERENGRFIEQINKKRKELENFVLQTRSLATKLFQHLDRHYRERWSLDREIHQLFQEILSRDKLGKQSRKKIEERYEVLQMMGSLEPLEVGEDADADAELDEMFEEPDAGHRREEESKFESEPPRKTEESRKIRRTFLRLAENFHPDKVTDHETRTHHTEIMKEINRAYRENDLARLLEIERKHLEAESLDRQNQSDIERRCQMLEEQNRILKSQYETLKKELRLVKNTPEGAMLSDYRKAKREKIDLVERLSEEIAHENEAIAELRDFVKDFRDGKITLKDFLSELPSRNDLRQEIMEQFMEEMFGEMEWE